MEGPNRGPIVESIFTPDAAALPPRAGRLHVGDDALEPDRPARRRLGRLDRAGRRRDVCTVLPGHDGESTLGLTMAPVDFIKLITKSGNPVMMFMTGKLKASGDVALAAGLAGWFDVPAPDPSASRGPSVGQSWTPRTRLTSVEWRSRFGAPAVRAGWR